MINFIIRNLIGLALAAGIFMVAMNLLHVPKDQFMPAPMVVDDMTLKAAGTETSTRVGGYADHFMTGGVDYQWYESYTFKPMIMQHQPDGTDKLVPSDQPATGEVEISRQQFEGMVDGSPVTVSYDPYNPSINGVHDSIGHISTKAGWVGTWIWYLVGIIAVGFAIGGVMFKILPSGMGD